jgi:hypothetical protein
LSTLKFDKLTVALDPRVITLTEGQPMTGYTKLIGIAAIAVAAATASFQDDVALALGVTALVAAAFTAVAILVGAAVATRQSRPSVETGRAPVLDATPVISPLQEQ